MEENGVSTAETAESSGAGEQQQTQSVDNSVSVAQNETGNEQTVQPDDSQGDVREMLQGQMQVPQEGVQEEEPEEEFEGYHLENVPEGIDISQEALDSITPLLRSLGCDNETANKLAQFHFGQIQETVNNIGQYLAEEQQKADEARRRQVDEWVDEIRNDENFRGGLLKENLMKASNVVERFGGEELAQLLVETGLDMNPSMVRFLSNLGNYVAEDHWADGSRRGTPKSDQYGDVAKILFNKTPTA